MLHIYWRHNMLVAELETSFDMRFLANYFANIDSVADILNLLKELSASEEL